MAKRNEEPSPLSLKRRLFLRHSAVKVPKLNCVGVRKPFDACRISTTKLVLTLLNFGLNKRWHSNGIGRSAWWLVYVIKRYKRRR